MERKSSPIPKNKEITILIDLICQVKYDKEMKFKSRLAEAFLRQGEATISNI